MKLRNKKTGRIVTLLGSNRAAGVICLDLILHNKDGEASECCYNSVAELNEEWEDYKPTEPYIKDEKIRKFVRDWAEMNSISEIIVFDQANSPYIPAGQVVFAENAGSLRVCFRTDEKFDTNKIYTITELCGEEEE